MIFTIYQPVALLVVSAIASFAFYNGKRDGNDSLVGWKRLPSGMIMVTAGMSVGNLKDLLHNTAMKSQK